MDGEPSGLSTQWSAQSSQLRGIQWLTVGFLVGLDKRGQRFPLLAEQVPSRARGTWLINPDGGMVTTWMLRTNATWHDGAPLVASDFVFGWLATIDPELPSGSPVAARLISSAEALNAHTLVLTWKVLSPLADALSQYELQPIPAHLLEDTYRTSKQRFVDGPHWSTEFVGAGPFRLAKWERGVGMTLLKHHGYGPGAPNIDQINVQFMADQRAITAAILAGTTDLTDRIQDVALAGTLARSWQGAASDRVVLFAPIILRMVAFQHRDVPGAELAVRDRNVRKGLMHAIDRRALVDTVWEGYASVADVPIAVSDPTYPAVHAAAAKYEFDPLKAALAFQDAGWQRGADGRVTNTAGTPLSIPLTTGAGSDMEPTAATIHNFWKQAGIDVPYATVDPLAARDPRVQASFPGTNYTGIILSDDQLAWTSSNVPNEANRYVGRNRGGYVNPMTDVLVSRVHGALDPTERESLLVELVRIWTDDVAIGPIHYRPEILVAGKGLKGYEDTIWPSQRAFLWNIHEWTM